MNKKSWLLPPLLLYLLSLVYHTMLFHSTLGLHGWLFHHFFFVLLFCGVGSTCKAHK